MAPEIVKKWQKDAKQWVRENAQENPNPKMDIENQAQPETGSKRKMSPRSLQRVRKIVDQRVRNTKQDYITEDDREAMRKLCNQLL